MADVFGKEKRSEIMRLVKGKNTKPEILLRRKLHSLGFRYRIYSGSLPGKPDIKLTKYKTLIFINGCFWHGHLNCKDAALPKSNFEYWSNKIKNNTLRDVNNYDELKKLGWNIIIVWTCQLNKINIDQFIIDLRNEIVGKISH